MAHPTAVIVVVGLTPALIGDTAPRLRRLAESGTRRRLVPVLPAVTCSVQSSMWTGEPPCRHGIVGNGWYNRELAEVQFWKQSNRLVGGEKVWEAARRRDPSVTSANIFCWYNMYSSVDWSVTPRPMYKADGRKLPDVYSAPPELRHRLQDELGTFPLFDFWGPRSSIRSSQWIADAARIVHSTYEPTLTLVYLPHLDYVLQRFGPQHTSIPAAVAEIDAVVGSLLDYFETCDVRVLVVSEYGIEPVDDAVHINRILREDGAMRVRDEQDLELLDAGASRAFAVADHQVAHVYVHDPDDVPRFRDLCREIDGVEQVLDIEGQTSARLNHARAGELVLVSAPRRWFSYDYWLDDARAPDFARTVDIHRKPGYDPLELFVDPALRMVGLRMGWKLLRNALGFRTLFDVIPLDTRLVRGSHGRVAQPTEAAPLLIAPGDLSDLPEPLPCTAVRDVILDSLFQQ